MKTVHVPSTIEQLEGMIDELMGRQAAQTAVADAFMRTFLHQAPNLIPNLLTQLTHSADEQFQALEKEDPALAQAFQNHIRDVSLKLEGLQKT